MIGGSAPPSKRARDMSLEELLQNAVRNHGEILAAQARAREAEAEVYRIRQKLLSQIAVTKLEYEAALAVYNETEERAKSYEQLFRQKSISGEEFRAGQFAKLKAKVELVKAESNLGAVAGVVPPEAGNFLSSFGGVSNFSVPNPMGAGILLPQSPPVYFDQKGQITIGSNPTAGPLGGMGTLAKIVEASPARSKTDAISKKLIPVLDKEIKLEIEGGISAVLDFLRPQFDPVELIEIGKHSDVESTLRSRNPMPMAAALQWIEDHYKVQFVCREYGVVVIDEKSSLPPGALTVREVWNRHRAEKEGRSPQP